MVQVTPFRIGIMGLITPKTKVQASPKSDMFLPVLVTAAALSKALNGQGADLTSSFSTS